MRFEVVYSPRAQQEVHISQDHAKNLRFHFGDAALVVSDDFKNVLSDLVNDFESYEPKQSME